VAAEELFERFAPQVDGERREVLGDALSDLLVELVLVDVALAVGRDDAVDLVAHLHQRRLDESDAQVLDREVDRG